MRLAEEVEPDALLRQKEIMRMAMDCGVCLSGKYNSCNSAGCVTELNLYLKEAYAVSLYRHACMEEDPEQSAAMIREAKLLFQYLYGKVDTPNVYICYADILRSEGKYELACSVLENAGNRIGDHILILINQVYAKVDYQNSADKDFSERLNPNSLKVLKAKAEPFVLNGGTFQFIRLGYYCADKYSTPENPVFNQIVSLKDSYKV